ncbi:MAG: SIMPL domain-containing protein [Phenylobacterium sp.]
MADRSPLLTTPLAAAIVAVGIAIAGALVGSGISNATGDNRSVTVRGLSERVVKSDLAVMPLRFAAAGNVLAEVQADVDGDLATVRRFLAEQGYAPSEIDLGRLEVTDQFAREYQANDIRARYRVAQTVIVRTANVDKVQATTRNLDGLVRQGVVLQDFNGPSYLFTKLNDVRPAMIAEATASARTGAQQFARDSQSSLGGIRSATQGSFEILGRDEFGDPASQVFKKLRVVTTVNYRLK